MSAKVYIEGNSLLIENDQGSVCSAKMPYPIAEYVLFDDIIVVRLKPPVESKCNENVFGVSLTCQVVWQIPEIKHVYADSPYTGMVKKDNSLMLFNWDGDDLIVEPKSGQILKKTFSK